MGWQWAELMEAWGQVPMVTVQQQRLLQQAMATALQVPTADTQREFSAPVNAL